MRSFYRKNFRFFLLICIAGLSLGIAMAVIGWKPAKAAIPGAAGDGIVNGMSGSYSANIPINVPNYYNLEPTLKLVYNSGGPNGFVGAGWSLSGADSFIERASSSWGIPKYDLTDKFMLDGVKLITSTAYGGTHVTQTLSYQRIKQDSTNNKWYVWEKDGTKKTYTQLYTVGSGFNNVFRWALSTEQDTNGNTITYNYWADPNENYYLDNITYNGYTIKFWRESRPDLICFVKGIAIGKTQYRLKAIQIMVGSSTQNAYKLSYSISSSTGGSLLSSVQEYGIDVVIDAAGTITGGTSFPAQTMAYQSGTKDFTVFRPGNNVTGDIYQDQLRGDPGVNIIQGDYNGDGKADFIRQEKGDWDNDYVNTFNVYFGNDNGTFNVVTPGSNVNWDMYQFALLGDHTNIIPGDFDGDGMTDFLRQEKGIFDDDINGSFQIYYSNGDGTFTRVEPGSNVSGDPYQDQLRYDPGCEIITGDYNGDGLTDFIRQEKGDWDNDINESFKVYLCNGGRTATFNIVRPGSNVSGDLYQDDLRYDPGCNIISSDFNGDGMTDFIRQEKGVWDDDVYNSFSIYYSNGDGTFTIYRPGSNVQSDPYQDHLRYDPGCSITPADFNGDGMTDFIRQEQNGWDNDSNSSFQVYFSNGNGGSFTIYTNDYDLSLGADGGCNLIIGDYNGDGKTDFIRQEKGGWDNDINDSFNIYYSNGDGTFLRITPGSNVSGDPYQDQLRYDPGCSIIPGDFNGDGITDFIRQERGDWDNDYTDAFKIYFSNCRKDLMISMTNGIGGTTTVAYTPSTVWPSQYTSRGGTFPTVSSVTVSDGRGNTGLTTYSYADAKMSITDKMFYGFGYFKAIINDVGTYVETYNRQTPQSMGQPNSIYTKNSSGAIFSYETYTYTETGNGITTPYTSFVTSKSEFENNLTANSRQTRVNMTYDTYGNITQIVNEGDIGVTGDESTKGVEYNINTTNYIVDKVKREKIYIGTTINESNKVDAKCYYYDSVVSIDTLPTKGNITKTGVWNSTTGNYIYSSATYDSYGNVTSITDPLGYTRSTTYDSTYHQYAVSETNALGYTTTTVWNYVLGVPTSKTDYDGTTSSISYDALGRKISNTDESGDVTTTQYLNTGDPNNQKVRTTIADGSADGLWSEEYRDGIGRIYKVIKKGATSGVNHIQEIVYNDTDNYPQKTSLWYLTGGTPVWENYEYDGIGRVTKTTHADGSYSTISYNMDVSNKPYTTATDELGHQKSIWVNAMEKTTRVQEKLGSSYYNTYFTYDIKGQCTQVTDDAGNTTTYIYDSLGLVTSNTDMDLGTTSFTYDAKGQVLTETDAKGQTTTNTYDAEGRLKTKTAGGETATWYYDESGHGTSTGKLTRVVYPAGNESYNYDSYGDLSSLTQTIGTVSKTLSYTYDSIGRSKTLTYPDGEVITYGYSTDGKLTSVSGYVSSIIYGANNEIKQINYSNGTVANYTYDPNRLWLNTTDVKFGGTTLYTASYTYDALQRVTNMTQGTPAPVTTNYTYDDLDRLLGVTGNQSQSFIYDSIGNMTYNTLVGGYSYSDSAHKHAVTSAGSGTYTYDANGNMITGNGKTFTWDAQDRLSSVTNVTTVTFAYASDNRRLSKTQGSNTTLYFGQILEQYNGSGIQYYYADNILVAKKDASGTKSWYHADRLGSIRLMTNASGAEVKDYDFRPFGEIFTQSGTMTNERGYTGHVMDAETGLIYMNARYYDPQLGRFLSPDTMVTDPDDPQDLNAYSYCVNNPINNTDPTGHVRVFAGYKNVKKYVDKKVTTKVEEKVEKQKTEWRDEGHWKRTAITESVWCVLNFFHMGWVVKVVGWVWHWVSNWKSFITTWIETRLRTLTTMIKVAVTIQIAIWKEVVQDVKKAAVATGKWVWKHKGTIAMIAVMAALTIATAGVGSGAAAGLLAGRIALQVAAKQAARMAFTNFAKLGVARAISAGLSGGFSVLSGIRRGDSWGEIATKAGAQTAIGYMSPGMSAGIKGICGNVAIPTGRAAFKSPAFYKETALSVGFNVVKDVANKKLVSGSSWKDSFSYAAGNQLVGIPQMGLKSYLGLVTPKATFFPSAIGNGWAQMRL